MDNEIIEIIEFTDTLLDTVQKSTLFDMTDAGPNLNTTCHMTLEHYTTTGQVSVTTNATPAPTYKMSFPIG
ncbi:MAG: hypothetical protein P8104_09590 [Gammaproteobacteria bacterium]